MEEIFVNDDRFQVYPSKDYLKSDKKYVIVDTGLNPNLSVSNDKKELIIIAIRLNRLQPNE
jgi:hypothetical protein